ncbi:MAG: hypothetical protein HC884_16805 [Chloroflexaceae bacterium]|nr:hypothetical protein [Chloroflexaceae bacterium]
MSDQAHPVSGSGDGEAASPRLSPTRPNPYVGPRAFTAGERLYGRNQEIRQLLNLLIAERIVLLYSPSGAGKTSLVQSALIPTLEREGFPVLPVMRVSLTERQPVPGDQTEPVPSVGAATPGPSQRQELSTFSPPSPPPPSPHLPNRYILSLLLSLEESLPPEEQTPPERLATMPFSDYLDALPPRPALAASGDEGEGEGEDEGEGEHEEDHTFDRSENEPASHKQVLIFDQFEEILTIDPTDQMAKTAFFAQVGAVLENRNRWALFVMREDYTAALDPYLRPIPTRFSTSFRLDLLGEAAARLAIQEPARHAGVEFSDAAATRLVDDLRRVRVQGPDGSVQVFPGPYVEPVQLQVVCYNLWERLPQGTTVIQEADLEMVGNVDDALADYYATCVASAALKTGVGERAIRDWFEHQLITEQHLRGQIVQGTDQSSGLDNRAIEHLIGSHLVRAEKRRGVVWLELAHDRLIEPIRKSNAAWREANLSMLQRQSAMWNTHGRTNDLLLRDRVLREAEQWAETHRDELTSVEQEFLQESQEAHTHAEQERRKNQVIQGLAVIALAAFLLALTASIVAIQERNRADAARARLINWQRQATAAAMGVEQATVAAGVASADRVSAQEMIATITDPLQGRPTGPQQATLEVLEGTVMAAEQAEQRLENAIRTATAVQESWGREVMFQETDIAEQGITTYPPPPTAVPTSRDYPPPSRMLSPTPVPLEASLTAAAHHLAGRETTVSERETTVSFRETQVVRVLTMIRPFNPPETPTMELSLSPIGTAPTTQETTETLQGTPGAEPYPAPDTPLPAYPTRPLSPVPTVPRSPTSTLEPVPYPAPATATASGDTPLPASPTSTSERYPEPATPTTGGR